MLIKTHSDAVMKQTSDILRIVSATPKAIAELQSSTSAQAAQQTNRLNALCQGLGAVTGCMETLSLKIMSLSKHARGHAASLRVASNRLAKLARNTKELLIL